MLAPILKVSFTPAPTAQVQTPLRYECGELAQKPSFEREKILVAALALHQFMNRAFGAEYARGDDLSRAEMWNRQLKEQFSLTEGRYRVLSVAELRDLLETKCLDREKSFAPRGKPPRFGHCLNYVCLCLKKESTAKIKVGFEGGTDLTLDPIPVKDLTLYLPAIPPSMAESMPGATLPNTEKRLQVPRGNIIVLGDFKERGKVA